jgi:hypothetical protein
MSESIVNRGWRDNLKNIVRQLSVPAPKGASESKEHSASLKRCPDTNLVFLLQAQAVMNNRDLATATGLA